jgi:putative radical SAM enzyme (TIGR03279 family)
MRLGLRIPGFEAVAVLAAGSRSTPSSWDCDSSAISFKLELPVATVSFLTSRDALSSHPRAGFSVVRIAEIESGSIADELNLEIGSRVVRINGERVRDGIDLTFLLSDTEIEVETVNPAGETIVYDIERDPGDPIGIVPAPDTIRECANKCVFCFIDGNPQDARKTLWLRDDDFRLSFTYGSYVTLTNLGPKGLQRLVDQRISPLYVSVHATEPKVRERLLVNQRAGLIMDQLRELIAGGLEVHTQIVLCPEWNDGAHLDRTIEDLWGLGGAISSLSVVPVGLTRYNLENPVRLLRPDEAAQAIDRVDEARVRGLAERSNGWCYAADEMYLIAGREVPDVAYYDDGALYENGVGSIRRFVDLFDAGVSSVPRRDGGRIRLVTGGSMAPFIRERTDRLEAATGATVEVVQVRNDYFGESVTIAGLLGGQDILNTLGEGRSGDVIVLPAEALNGDNLFIDNVPLSDFTARLGPAEIRTGYEITEALKSA